jgi:hypothetical protein
MRPESPAIQARPGFMRAVPGALPEIFFSVALAYCLPSLDVFVTNQPGTHS